MSEDEAFEAWLIDWGKYSLAPEDMKIAWKACAEQKDKIIEQQAAEIEALKSLIHDMSGAIWRLREYRYLVENEPQEVNEENKMQHWLNILDFCIGESRKLSATKTTHTGEAGE